MVWKRSANPLEIGISGQTIDTIKNTLLDYKFNSQYYLDIPHKSQLTIILFLCLFNSEQIKSKKVDALMNKIKADYLQELKSQYFDNFKAGQTSLHIPSRVENASAKFNYHERLIVDLVDIFENSASLGLIFENPYYKNKIQIRQFKDGALVPFKNTGFKAQQNQPRNDIILIPYETGYYLACFSTREAKKTEIKQQEKKQLKEELIEEEIKQEPLKKKEQKKQQQKQGKPERLKDNQPEQKIRQISQQNPSNASIQEFQFGTFLVLLAILIICLVEAQFELVSKKINEMFI